MLTTEQLIHAETNKNKLINAEKIIIIGYSPTGGGHATRALEIVTQALRDGHIKQHDVVIMHLPNIHHAEPKFNPGLAPADRAAKRLMLRGVHVLMAVADKAVIGYLDNEGCSDNVAILKRFAAYPYREKAAHGDIAHCAKPWLKERDVIQVYGGANDRYDKNNEAEHQAQIALDNTISAHDLFRSLAQVTDNILAKVYVISDMDPYLQKAAQKAGIPNERRLDQQSHAILIQNLAQLVNKSQSKSLIKNAVLVAPDKRLDKENAILAKVLDGSGAKVSHIALGQTNTLQRRLKDTKCLLEAITDRHVIDKNTLKKDVKQKVLLALEQGARRIPLDVVYDGELGGIMIHPDLAIINAKRLIYIYIHGAGINKIGDYIRSRLNEHDRYYKENVFLFCRTGPIKQIICPACSNWATPNAMEFAYFVGADGITNTGAGTTGEFAFLHRNGGDTSKIALFPQISQHEQEINADFIHRLFEEKDASSLASFVLLGNLKNTYQQTIDQLMKRQDDHDDDERSMEQFLNGVLYTDAAFTIPKQASDILFGQDWQTVHAESYEISLAEQHMRQNEELTAHRRYLKLVVCALLALVDHWQFEITQGKAALLVDGFFATPMLFKIKQKSEPILATKQVLDLCLYLYDQQLKDNLCHSRASSNKSLGDDTVQQAKKEKIFASYSKISTFFSNVSQHYYTNQQAKQESGVLLEALGQQVKLGF